jgi:hypothetical protein
VELYKKANAALIVGPGGFCCKRDFVAALTKKETKRRRGLQQRVD